jgi:hypothetical protein
MGESLVPAMTAGKFSAGMTMTWLHQRNRPLVFVAVIAAREDGGGAIAIANRDDRQMHRPPARIIARMRDAEMAEMLAVRIEIDSR